MAARQEVTSTDSPPDSTSDSRVRFITGRPSNACVRCKSRKIKCTYEYPACSACKKSTVECEYPGTDKPNWDYVRQLEGRLKALEDAFKSEGDASSRKRRRGDPNTTITARSLTSDRSTQSFRLGPPSSLQALDRLPSAVDLVGLIDDPLDNENARDGDSDNDPIIDLPPRRKVDEAVDWFLDQVNPPYPIFQEGAFRNQVEHVFVSDTDGNQQAVGRERARSPQTVYAIYIILALHAWKREHQTSSFTTIKRQSKEYWESSLSYLRAAWSGNRLGRLQVILLQLSYIMRDPDAGDIWDHTGRAVRNAIELGLHHDPQASARNTFSPLEIDLRRRLFWTTYAFDRVVSVALGRPTSLHHDWISTQFASIVSDEHITDTTVIPERIDRRKEAGVHHAKFRILQWEIHDRLCTVRASSLPPPPPDWFESISQRLLQWRTSWQPRPTEYMSDEWLEMHYNLLRSMLNRPNPGNAQPNRDQLFEAISAASAIIKTHKSGWRQRNLTCVWISVHHVFMAGVTYLNSIWIANLKGWNIVTSYVNAIMDIQTCSQVLEAMSASERGTDKMRDAFEIVSAAVVGHLSSQVESNRYNNPFTGIFNMGDSTPFDINTLFASPARVSPSNQPQQQHLPIQAPPPHTLPSGQAPQAALLPTNQDVWVSPVNPGSSSMSFGQLPIPDQQWPVSNQFPPASDTNVPAFEWSVEGLPVEADQRVETSAAQQQSSDNVQATTTTLQKSTFDTIENFFSNPFSELASVEGLTCSIGAFLNNTNAPATRKGGGKSGKGSIGAAGPSSHAKT